MLVAPALVLVWEFAVCDSYEYEYAQGDGGDTYDTYIEGQVTFHPRPDVGRVRRFGEDIRALTTADSYDVSGAIMQILGERRPDAIKNVTPSSSYIPEEPIFTPLHRVQFNKPAPTRRIIFTRGAETDLAMKYTPFRATNVDSESNLESIRKPQLDERGLQTILELTERNTMLTRPEVTEEIDDSTTVIYQQLTEGKDVDERSTITNHITRTEENTNYLYEVDEKVVANNKTIAMHPITDIGDTGDIIRYITTITHRKPDRTEYRGDGDTFTELLSTSHLDASNFSTEQILTKMTEYEDEYPMLKRPQKTSKHTIIAPTTTKIKINTKGTEEGLVNFTNTDFSGGDVTKKMLRDDDADPVPTDETTGTVEESNTTDSTTTLNATDPTTTPTTTVATTTTTIRVTTTKLNFDIEKFLEIIANLTYDYETNLTSQVNESLHRFSIPTCRTPTVPTTTETTTTAPPPEYVALNRTIIAKCFVCGLDTPGIPYDADCADAFAGDFLPLVPQDPRAKGKIARFRKYCRYGEIHNYLFNASQPRSLFGRWTGGCSVRWTDLTGIYTQRSCRNRKRPTTGLHYGSKRMAKLEAALSLVEQGCIVSPVATLLPLSRGISLFARFHACVCLGNWCNAATRNGPSLDALVTALTLAVALQAV